MYFHAWLHMHQKHVILSAFIIYTLYFFYFSFYSWNAEIKRHSK